VDDNDDDDAAQLHFSPHATVMNVTSLNVHYQGQSIQCEATLLIFIDLSIDEHLTVRNCSEIA